MGLFHSVALDHGDHFCERAKGSSISKDDGPVGKNLVRKSTKKRYAFLQQRRESTRSNR